MGEAAVETLAGLEERHPSRGILLFPEPEAADGIDAKVSVIAFPLREHRRHIAAEVIELRLRGRMSEAPASIVNPLLVPALPVFLRWRGRPPFGEQKVEQLVEVCDRLIVDSREWPDVPKAYAELPFDRAACSDIAWRRTEPWRRCLARLWPGIAELRTLRVEGPVAEASLLAGWLRSRLERDIELEHEAADELAAVDVDGAACPVPRSGRPRAISSRRSWTSSRGIASTRPLRSRPLLSDVLSEKKGVNGVAEGAFRRHYQHVYGFFRRRVRDPHRAEELTQDVFAAAAAGLPKPKEGDPPVLAWLYTVARRRFVDESRRLSRERRPKDLPARTTSDYGPFVARELREALGELPRGHSQVVVLKLLRGMTFAEIGAEVGLTEAAAKMRFRRALETLRAELIERGIEP